jgi:hypothetical protein
MQVQLHQCISLACKTQETDEILAKPQGPNNLRKQMTARAEVSDSINENNFAR